MPVEKSNPKKFKVVDEAKEEKPIEEVKEETPTEEAEEEKPTEEAKEEKPIADAEDLDSLWMDTTLGDGLTETLITNIPIDKPKDFFRVIADPSYRRKCTIYTHKVEGQIEEQRYIIDKPMQGLIEEGRPCILVTVVYRDGSLRLWPLKLPRDGEKDNRAWVSARAAARLAMEKWIKIVWIRDTYQIRPAQEGYAPEPPDVKKLPTFNKIVTMASGEHGIIRNRNHPIARNLFGAPPAKLDGDGDDDLS